MTSARWHLVNNPPPSAARLSSLPGAKGFLTRLQSKRGRDKGPYTRGLSLAPRDGWLGTEGPQNGAHLSLQRCAGEWSMLFMVQETGNLQR